jgi:MoxR-like ATPase
MPDSKPHDQPYTGKPSAVKPAAPRRFSVVDLEGSTDPAGYLPDEGLVDAVNVAILLQQPLLLTGEPGTGKTQLAFSVAWELGLPEPLSFETKSTSVSRDLFYIYDNIGRFQAAHSSTQNIDPKLFIRFNALGLAILRTLPPAVASKFLSDPTELHKKPTRSVVLIDEVDKAPRDLPNDILNEIESQCFRIPELSGEVVAADRTLRPLVVITSNSEKSLPDPFLRRCIFYHIPFPDEVRLESIVQSRIGGLAKGPDSMVSGMINFFERLREPAAGLRKKPGTAELINWVNALLAVGVDPSTPLKRQSERLLRSLSTLSKHPDDEGRVRETLKAWIHE